MTFAVGLALYVTVALIAFGFLEACLEEVTEHGPGPKAFVAFLWPLSLVLLVGLVLGEAVRRK